MEYVIGIDGGGTKTSLEISDLNGKLLFRCIGGPSNLNSSSEQDVESVLNSLIYEAMNGIKLPIENCLAVCIGASGAGRAHEKTVIKKIISNMGFKCKTIVVTDAETALYGGTGKYEGIILISGTGSICYGRSVSGNVARAGGWGHIIGDEGSGYDIGVKALKAVVRSYDGRGKKTILEDLIFKYLEINSIDELINFTYKSNKNKLADISKIVNDAFLKGDEISKTILDESSYELYLCAESVIIKLGFIDKDEILAVSGGTIINCRYLFDAFKSMINKNYPNIKVIKAKDDPAWGAVLMAINDLK